FPSSSDSDSLNASTALGTSLLTSAGASSSTSSQPSSSADSCFAGAGTGAGDAFAWMPLPDWGAAVPLTKMVEHFGHLTLFPSGTGLVGFKTILQPGQV